MQNTPNNDKNLGSTMLLPPPGGNIAPMNCMSLIFFISKAPVLS